MQCENSKIQTHHSPIFDEGEVEKREIRISAGECQKYVLIPRAGGTYHRHFIVEEGAVFRGGAIAMGADMVLELSISLEGDRAEGSLDLLALATDSTALEIDGVGRVTPGCADVRLRIDQENILLGKGARVRGRPVLEVATDSIEGGHSCRIHRISDESVFYLSSHGIDRSSAEMMLIEAQIRRITHLLEESGDERLEQVKTALIGKISRS